MSVLRWRSEPADPFGAFDELQEQINRLFEGSRHPEASGIFEQSFSAVGFGQANERGLARIRRRTRISIRDHDRLLQAFEAHPCAVREKHHREDPGARTLRRGVSNRLSSVFAEPRRTPASYGGLPGDRSGRKPARR